MTVVFGFYKGGFIVAEATGETAAILSQFLRTGIERGAKGFADSQMYKALWEELDATFSQENPLQGYKIVGSAAFGTAVSMFVATAGEVAVIAAAGVVGVTLAPVVATTVAIVAAVAAGYAAGEYYNWAFEQTVADSKVLNLAIDEVVTDPVAALWDASHQRVSDLVASTEFASNLVADNLFSELVTLNPELQTALQDAGAQVTQMSQDLAAAWDGFQTSLDSVGETVANDFLNFAMGLSESIEGIPESLLTQYNDMLAAQDGLVAILDAAGNSAEKQFLNLAIGLSDALSSAGESASVSLNDLARALGNAMDGVNPWLQLFGFVSGSDPSLAGPGGRDGGGGLGGAGATADGFGAGEIVRSPLILDLDGDGVETLGIDTGIAFDHDSNGFAEATGWAGKDDGVLVLDRDGNGQIDNGGELFGNSTQVAGSAAANGFAALSALDTNFDGKVDAIDIEFANLRVWRDSNSDGAVQGGELLTLEQAGVASLDTGYVNQGFIDANLDYDPDGTNSIDANENQHRQVGSYTRTDGTAASMNDVWFKSNTAYTVDKDLIALDVDSMSRRQVCRAPFRPHPDAERASAVRQAVKLGRPLGNERIAKAIRARLGIWRNSGTRGWAPGEKRESPTVPTEHQGFGF